MSLNKTYFHFQALIKVVQMQQAEAERERKKEEEERRQKREQIKRVKRMMEAAFDGDVDEMKQILKEVRLLIKSIIMIIMFFFKHNILWEIYHIYFTSYIAWSTCVLYIAAEYNRFYS